ncbi:uncharacterized protein WCC33_006512 isoform 2-T4 [Rhinophrynus dorsalis]
MADAHFPFVCRCQKGLRKSFNKKIICDSKDERMSVSTKLNSGKEQGNNSAQSYISLNDIQSELEKHEKIVQEEPYSDKNGLQEDKTFPNPSSPDESEKVIKVMLLENSQKKTNETSHNTSGEITAQIKSGYVNLNLEIKQASSSNSRSHILISNKKSLKKSRSYHDTQHQQSQHSGNHSCDIVGDVSRKDKDHSVTKKQIYERPLIRLEIIGEGFEVKYKTMNHNLTVHIEADKVRKENEEICGRCYSHNTDYLSNDGSCSSYPVSDFSLHETKEFCANYIHPEWCINVPPPEEFADGRATFADAIRKDEALLPEDSSSIPSLSSCWSELETEQGPKQDGGCITEAISKLDSSLCSPYLDKYKNCSRESFKPKNLIPFISNKELKSNQTDYQPKNNSAFDSKVVRRKTFPEMYFDPPIGFNHFKYSAFDSTNQTFTDTVQTHLSSTSNSKTEREQKHAPPTKLTGPVTAVPCASCSSDHDDSNDYNTIASDNEKTVSYSTEHIGDDVFFVNNCSDFPQIYEERHDSHTLYSVHNVDVSDKQFDEQDDFEDLMNEEHTEFTESGFDEEMLDSDNHAEIQEYSELQNKQLLIQVTPPSRSTSREYILEKSNSSRMPTDYSHYPESQVKEISQSNVTEPEIITKKRRGSVVTVVTGDLEKRILMQGDNQAVNDTITSRVHMEYQTESKQSCIIHRDSVLTPVSDVEEPYIEDNLHSSFEEQSQVTLKDISLQTSEAFDPFLSIENQTNLPEDTCVDEINEGICPQLEEGKDMFNNVQVDDTSPRTSSDSAIPGTSFESLACKVSCLPKSDSEENGCKSNDKKEDPCENEKTETPKKKTCKKDPKTELINKHLKLPKESVLKESRGCESPQEEASERWAKKRKQFKETKNYNSAGGSSVTSNITEESGNSEETRSVDIGIRSDSKDKGLYTESFHSASWIFRGDDCSPDNSPRCLSKRPRSVAIRERTVRIGKGTGDYPWGFRIQFSKPILVTEVDTNGAAEEAGLQVGDIVMGVNGTDVTSIPHSEAATLARQEKSCSYRTVLAVLTKRVSPMYGPKIGNIHQFLTFDINHGPDLLTLVVGSDISRFPTTPRPTCRGYLHKRTHSGLLKGWRKRWFVLKHDGSLQYYKQKKDEGKSRPLEVTKLEGAEIGVDTTLGKPFVFKCVPQSGNRTFYFCATSNQEMKRWLEAMDKAVHPLNQNHVWVDVTMHNISLPPLAIKNPECLGLLHQLDRNKDVWVQHYCILKDGCLYFYSSIRSTNALGGIYLQGYTVCEQSPNSRRCIIELRPPSEEFKTFYLSAGNAAENKRWITALKISINKWLPLHQAIQDFMSRPPEETRM